MVFCLGEKEGMQLNDDCSSFYCRVGGLYVDMERRQLVCGGKTYKVFQNRLALKCKANGNEYYGSLA